MPVRMGRSPPPTINSSLISQALWLQPFMESRLPICMERRIEMITSIYNTILHSYTNDYTFTSIPDILSIFQPNPTIGFKHTSTLFSLHKVKGLDQVYRSYIYKYIHQSRNDIYETLSHFQKYNVPIKLLLEPKLYRLFIIRIYMYTFENDTRRLESVTSSLYRNFNFLLQSRLWPSIIQFLSRYERISSE